MNAAAQVERIREAARGGPPPAAWRARELGSGGDLVREAEEVHGFAVRRYANGGDPLATLNYAFLTGDADQFRHPRGEFRGLTVSLKTGCVRARPFHKFWNYGPGRGAEYPWADAVVTEKIDGSLTFPVRPRDEPGELGADEVRRARWATRSGLTDVAAEIEEWLDQQRTRREFAETLGRLLQATMTDPRDGAACTPMFEWSSPRRRIVVRCERTVLTLLAVRRIGDGRYWSRRRVEEAFAGAAGECAAEDSVLKIAAAVDAGGNLTGEADRRRLHDSVRAWEGGREGVVVEFPDGNRLKLKSDEYLRLHAVRSGLEHEHRVAGVVLAGQAEEAAAMADPEDAAVLRGYAAQVEERLTRTMEEIATRIAKIVEGIGGPEQLESGEGRKQAAKAWIAGGGEGVALRGAGFEYLRQLRRHGGARTPAFEAAAGTMRTKALAACGSGSSFAEKVVPLLGEGPPRWDGVHGTE